MKRVLIITYYWPPSGGSGVQRWLKFSKYLPEFGWQPVVYTPSNPELPARDESLLAEIPVQAEILEQPITEPYAFYRKWMGKSGKQPVVNPIVSREKKSWKEKFPLFVRANVFVPDPRILWVKPSISYLKEYLREYPVDAIVSTGPPHSMHLIARGIKKEFPWIPWIADFRDPWTRIFYFKHLPMLPGVLQRHRRMEASVLKLADEVVVVSQQMQQEFQQILTQRKGNPEKVNLITNGYDDADFVGQDNPFDGGFHVVHTGLLSEDGNPESCWEALGARYRMDPDFRRKLRITLIGKTDAAVLQSISKNGLDAALNNLGYLPHNLIAAYQRNASLLLLPLRKEPEAKGILTGKFFEYLAAGRPILAFGPEDGDVASILQETQAGKIFDWNARESISKALHELFLAHQNGTPAPWKGKAELIQKYSRKELTARMVELLEWE